MAYTHADFRITLGESFFLYFKGYRAIRGGKGIVYSDLSAWPSHAPHES